MFKNYSILYHGYKVVIVSVDFIIVYPIKYFEITKQKNAILFAKKYRQHEIAVIFFAAQIERRSTSSVAC